MLRQIPLNWQKVKLGTLLKEVIIGGRPKGGTLTVFDGIPSLGAEHLNDYGSFDFSTIKYVPEKYFKESKNGKIQINDVICVKDGATIGKVSRVNNSFPFKEAMINEHVFILRSDESLLDQIFLFYKLRTNEGKFTIKGNIGGSAQGGLKKDFLNYWKTEIPPIIAQQKIASILSSFDNKIELNNKIAKTLEDIAQVIFKEWFVKFRFPGWQKTEFVESELGKIPKGWKVNLLKDVVKIKKGLSYSSKEISDKKQGLPMINLANFKRGGGFNPEGIKFFTGTYKESDLVNPGDILIAMTDLTSNREVIGHPARVPINNWNKILISLDVCSIEVEKTSIEFFYYLLLRKEFAYLMASSTGGTNVAHLSQTMIKNYYFILPSKKLILEFKKIIYFFYLEQNKILSENQKLAQMRDLLLPKLMNGRIKI